MIIDQMISTVDVDTSNMTQADWERLEFKFATIEGRIDMQMKNAIIDYVSEQMSIEGSKKKPKPYYRKGRWE